MCLCPSNLFFSVLALIAWALIVLYVSAPSKRPVLPTLNFVPQREKMVLPSGLWNYQQLIREGIWREMREPGGRCGPVLFSWGLAKLHWNHQRSFWKCRLCRAQDWGGREGPGLCRGQSLSSIQVGHWGLGAPLQAHCIFTSSLRFWCTLKFDKHSILLSVRHPRFLV